MTDEDDVSTCSTNNNKTDYSVYAVSETGDSSRGKRGVAPDKTYSSCRKDNGEGVAIDETTEKCDQDNGKDVNNADTYCIFNKDYGRAVDVYDPYARTKRGGRRTVVEAVAIDKMTSSCDGAETYYSSSNGGSMSVNTYDICDAGDDSTIDVSSSSLIVSTDSFQGDSGRRTVVHMTGVSYVIDKNGGERNINYKKSLIIKSRVHDRLNRSQYENRGFITQEWDSSISLDDIQDESLVHIELGKLPTYAKVWEKNQILKISHEYTEPEYVINAIEYPHLFNNIVNRKF